MRVIAAACLFPFRGLARLTAVTLLLTAGTAAASSIDLAYSAGPSLTARDLGDGLPDVEFSGDNGFAVRAQLPLGERADIYAEYLASSIDRIEGGGRHAQIEGDYESF